MNFESCFLHVVNIHDESRLVECGVILSEFVRTFACCKVIAKPTHTLVVLYEQVESPQHHFIC